MVHEPEKEFSSPQRLAIGVRDFCRSFGVSRSFFYEQVRAGKIKTVRIAGRRLIPTSEALRLLNTGGDNEAR